MNKTVVAAVAAAALAMPLTLGAATASARGATGTAGVSALTSNQTGYPLQLVSASGVTGATGVAAGDGNGGEATSSWTAEDLDAYTLVYRLNDPDYSPMTITFHGKDCTLTGQPASAKDRYQCDASFWNGTFTAQVVDTWT